MTPKAEYVVVSDGLLLGFFNTIEDARRYIKNLITTTPKGTTAQYATSRLRILKIQEVYKYNKVDETKDTEILSPIQTSLDDDLQDDNLFKDEDWDDFNFSDRNADDDSNYWDFD